ncbi:peptidase M24 [Halothece sp. PCC 7418]|uniref:aminopeptidase P family protein n=1 Tax=Halothece sp. (strain PCC 7418) TaxID=65093 RepID=UPI0002A07A00|nr:aminopeptidase P family protein [Halothece sp. PCC 7418]AFZ44369.1 peptidase M24 [Halothece sp. PCC 7418]
MNHLKTTLKQRRQKLAQTFPDPVLLWSGCAPSRNFPANTFPFRASSHFLYFAGLNLEDAVIELDNGKLTLFLNNPSAESILWGGEKPNRDDIAETIGADRAYPLSELTTYHSEAATIALSNPMIVQQQKEVLKRDIPQPTQATGEDQKLIEAIINLRLCHDESAIAQIRQAAAVSIQAHQAGMKATQPGKTEADVRAAMESVMIAHNQTCAYGSIVTCHGEVLHNEDYSHTLQAGDLILADVGAESLMGWASDITRTFPVSGQFSATQREIYDLVLSAHDACIEAVAPGVEYKDIHWQAAKIIAEGLVEIGILRGTVSDLLEKDAHALFFPHGVGHLLGLDVHDMEDLGDRAGYAPGRQRSQRFGLGNLRLDRALQPGMTVTIEPGFYQVPAILNQTKTREQYQDMIDWERLAQFADVRGIRIEDDVLVTSEGAEVLTAKLPSQRDRVEALTHA